MIARTRELVACASLACAVAACRESTTTPAPSPSPSATSSATAAPNAGANTTPASNLMHLAADGADLRLSRLAPDAAIVENASGPIAFVIGGAIRPGTQPSGVEEAWRVARSAPAGANAVAWSSGTVLVMDAAPATGCASMRVASLAAADAGVAKDAGAIAKDAGVVDAGAAPKLDARVCATTMADAKSTVVFAGIGFAQRAKRGEGASGPPLLLPWNDETGKCPSNAVTLGGATATDREIDVWGRCGDTTHTVVLHHDGSFWHRTEGPDDGDMPVAFTRTKGGDHWLYLAKVPPDPRDGERATGSLWRKPKDGLWNRVRFTAPMPDAGAPESCSPSSFWPRSDDDLWATYECRKGGAKWSFVVRTGAVDKVMRVGP